MQNRAIDKSINLRRLTVFPLLCLSLGWTGVAAGVDAPQQLGPDVFAKVGDYVIDVNTYNNAVKNGARQRFYHGNIPEDRINALKEEVAQDLIEQVLLTLEAEKRGIEPDQAGIQAELDKYDQRYASSSRWKEQRATLLPKLKKQLEIQSRVKRLEQNIRQIREPSEEEIRNYYKDNPDKFTTPERKRIAIILLRVPPSSDKAAWDAAREEGGQIYKRLHNGADFAQLAEIHSADPSAEQGGDMGYLHKGMLSSEAEQVIEQLKVGQFSEPVTLLQGVALFKLKERTEQILNPFTKVKVRAKDLLMRDMGDEAWKSLIENLKNNTTIIINSKLTQTPNP